MNLINAVIGLVTGIIGFVIIDQVIATQSWNSSLSSLIVSYIVPIGLLGLLGAAAWMMVK